MAARAVLARKLQQAMEAVGEGKTSGGAVVRRVRPPRAARELEAKEALAAVSPSPLVAKVPWQTIPAASEDL